MLAELEARSLLDATSAGAAYEDYATAIVDENVLAKSTRATRQKSLRHLRELYALRTDAPLFAGPRPLWVASAPGRGLA